jgi:hypothetical protein
MWDLSNDTKKHTTKSRETIPLIRIHQIRPDLDPQKCCSGAEMTLLYLSIQQTFATRNYFFTTGCRVEKNEKLGGWVGIDGYGNLLCRLLVVLQLCVQHIFHRYHVY